MNTNRKNIAKRMIASILSAVSLLTASAAFMPAMTVGAAECGKIEVIGADTVPADQDCSLNRDITSFFIVKMPNKLYYKIGEELDLTGGTAFANGIEDGRCWDAFELPMDHYTVDASDFDNTKPGIYTIRLICTIPRKHAEVTFRVTVLQEVPIIENADIYNYIEISK